MWAEMSYLYHIFRMTDGSLSVLCTILFSPKQSDITCKSYLDGYESSRLLDVVKLRFSSDLGTVVLFYPKSAKVCLIFICF